MTSKHYGMTAGGIISALFLASLAFGGGSKGQLSPASLGLSFDWPSPREETPSRGSVNTEHDAHVIGNDSAASSDRYTLAQYFSIATSEEFRFKEIQDDKGIIVLAESPGESFQVFIAPFDEPGPLTPARIKKDLPQKVITNARNGTLDGVSALAFTSEEDGDAIFEIWLVHEGYLYQITSLQAFADRLQEVLQSWRFAD